MEQYTFEVKGSSGLYKVTFTKKDEQVLTSCTCQAGEHSLHCKHRLAIIAGDTSNVLSGNESQIELVAGLIKGTVLEEVLCQFEQAKKEFDLAERRLNKAKKVLTKALNGRKD
jgi:hypothetical protein